MSQFTLKQFRQLAGLTQREVAKELKISNTTLCNWERGKSFPNQPQIEKLCVLYNCKYDSIDFAPSKNF